MSPEPDADRDDPAEDGPGPTWSPVPDADDYEQDLAHRFSRGFEPVTAGDWVLVAIALLDVLMLLARDVYGNVLPALAVDAIVWVDLAILAIFALEFLAEARRASSWLLYTRNHWYEVAGMIPIAHWGLRSFRLVRLLRMFVVSHYPPEKKPERDWSFALVRGVIHHYRSVFVEEVTDPIVLTSIDVLKGPMVRARWAGTIGESLEERREHIHVVVDDAMRHTDGMSYLMRTRHGQRMVTRVTDAVLDTVIHTLESDELNEVIGESVGDVLDELREKVREKDYREGGATRLRPSFDN